MKKPLRRGQCPGCYHPCRRVLVRFKRGAPELFQPYCARCTTRYRYGPGIYLRWPEEAGVPTWAIGGYLGSSQAGGRRKR